MKITIASILFLSLCLFSCSSECDLGYEGDDCNIESRQKFIGTWTTTMEDCDLGTSTASSSYTISTADAINQVEITTPARPDLILIATATGNSLSIIPQEIDLGILTTYGGKASITGTELNLTITQDTDGLVRTCMGIYTQ